MKIAAIPENQREQHCKGLFDKHQMDFEPVFRAVGWKVEYDKPGYCETYDAFFEFTPKKETGYGA